jgi:hypothetical protein
VLPSSPLSGFGVPQRRKPRDRKRRAIAKRHGDQHAAGRRNAAATCRLRDTLRDTRRAVTYGPNRPATGQETALQHGPARPDGLTGKVEGPVRDNRVEVRVLFGASQKAPLRRGFRRFGPVVFCRGPHSMATPSDNWATGAADVRRRDPIRYEPTRAAGPARDCPPCRCQHRRPDVGRCRRARARTRWPGLGRH